MILRLGGQHGQMHGQGWTDARHVNSQEQLKNVMIKCCLWNVLCSKSPNRVLVKQRWTDSQLKDSAGDYGRWIGRGSGGEKISWIRQDRL